MQYLGAVLKITELYKRDLNDPDNHGGVNTHLEPDILQSELKWALGSITITKLVKVMKFQLSYFKSPKMMLLKCCTQNAGKVGKLKRGPHDWKRSVFIPIPKKGNVKECSNHCTTALISHTSKVMLKTLPVRFQ